MSDILTFNDTTSPIHFTGGAIEEIRRIQHAQRLPEGQFVRIGVKGGGCSGLSYILEVDQITEHDELFEEDGFQYVMDKRHRLYLQGTELYFAKGLDARGFEFKNPQASSTCGCGSSFSA
jgi:iron-sulfur cluster assembly protein